VGELLSRFFLLLLGCGGEESRSDRSSWVETFFESSRVFHESLRAHGKTCMNRRDVVVHRLILAHRASYQLVVLRLEGRIQQNKAEG
jgi:hypothetical protein